MLDKELDKLRNKELSFGCVIKVVEYDTGETYNDTNTVTIVDDNNGFLLGQEWFQADEIKEGHGYGYYSGHYIKEITGHTLTWGRIEHLFTNCNRNWGTYEQQRFIEVLRNIELYLIEMNAFDQNEVKWQQHEKWEMLKHRLIIFIEYL